MNIFNLPNPDRLMLINALYYRKSATNPVDHLDIIYRDLDTMETKCKIIENPSMQVYFTKPEYRNYSHNLSYMPLDRVYPKELNYARMTTEIAKELNDPRLNRYLSQCFDAKNWRGLKNAHKHPYVFASDFDIEDYVFIMWNLHYKNNLPKVPDAIFLDIEVDIKDVIGFPKPGSCPIDLVTLVDPTNMESYTFILRTKDNPLIPEFEEELDEVLEELHERFDDIYGILDYQFYMYDDERELLKDLMRLIHKLKRAFAFIFNMSFDIPFIIERMRRLGMRPEDYFCHPDFPTKELYYVKDTRHFNRANKGDYFRCSSYTKYMCQLNNYAAIRKGRHALPSYRLTDIGKAEIGDEKIDFSDVGNFKNFSRVNFKKYVIYNIKDVLLQVGTDNRTGDTEYIYHAAISSATKYEKIFRQTVFLRNQAYLEYMDQGLVICNNRNIDYEARFQEDQNLDREDDEEEDDSVDGALVSNPLLNGYHGIKIMGMPSKFIFDNVIDMDFASMYPNIIIVFNIADCTMIGKLIIDETAKSYYANHEITIDSYDAGKDFMDNYVTGNILMLGSKWLNLPSVEEALELFEEELFEDEAA